MSSSGVMGALFAILLNVMLPLAIAVSVRATDPYDFTAAICHGGSARTAAVNPAAAPVSDPSQGPGDHDCCAACLLPLSHALIPPQVAGTIAAAPLPIVRHLDRDDAAPRQSLPPPFRSRAPPIVA